MCLSYYCLLSSRYGHDFKTVVRTDDTTPVSVHISRHAVVQYAFFSHCRANVRRVKPRNVANADSILWRVLVYSRSSFVRIASLLGELFLRIFRASIPTTAQSFGSPSNPLAPLWLARSNDSTRRRPHSQVNASFHAYGALDHVLPLCQKESCREYSAAYHRPHIRRW